MKISYTKLQREIAVKENRVLVTLDLNAKHLKKGAYCIAGSFREEDLKEVKAAFAKLVQLMSDEKA